jgi:signal transduction histidine kinase
MQLVPEQIAQVFGFREVAVYDSTSNMTFASTNDGPHLIDRLRDIAQRSQVHSNLQPEASLCDADGSFPGTGKARALLRNSDCARVEMHFTGRVGHDLKTLLTSIKAEVSCLLLQSTSVTEKDRELLHIIGEEAERLERIGDAASAKFLTELPQVTKSKNVWR